jgi:hypothetical protein
VSAAALDSRASLSIARAADKGWLAHGRRPRPLERFHLLADDAARPTSRKRTSRSRSSSSSSSVAYSPAPTPPIDPRPAAGWVRARLDKLRVYKMYMIIHVHYIGSLSTDRHHLPARILHNRSPLYRGRINAYIMLNNILQDDSASGDAHHCLYSLLGGDPVV